MKKLEQLYEGKAKKVYAPPLTALKKAALRARARSTTA